MPDTNLENNTDVSKSNDSSVGGGEMLAGSIIRQVMNAIRD